MNLEELFEACKKNQLPTVRLKKESGGIGNITSITTNGVLVKFPWLPYSIMFHFKAANPKETRTIEELSIHD